MTTNPRTMTTKPSRSVCLRLVKQIETAADRLIQVGTDHVECDDLMTEIFDGTTDLADLLRRANVRAA